MADVMSFKDGAVEVIFSGRDFAEIVDRYMGYEASEYARDLAEEYDSISGAYEELCADSEKELDGLREAQREKLLSVREMAEELLDLLAMPRLDRQKISRAAGEIYRIVNKEL